MKKLARTLLVSASALLAAAAGAAVTDITSSPLEVAASNTTVKPNIMLLFDDSGSMAWDFMPDWIGPSPLPGNGVDKPRCGTSGRGGGCVVGTTTGLQGDPPYYSYQFNGIFYNPNIYYPPGVSASGAVMKSYTAANSTNWTKVPVDAYGSVSGTINLVTGFPEAVFCTTASVTPPSTNCKRNGIDTGGTFLYNLGSAGNGYPDAVLSSASGNVTVTLNGTNTIKVMPGTYENAAVQYGNPFYYRITAAEYCTDGTLTSCVLSTSSTSVGSTSYATAAPIRYCLNATDANSLSAVTGTTTVTWSTTPQPRCQQKYNQRLGYQYPRFGYFTRNDIVASTTTYTRGTAATTTRTDCAAAPVCTYAEEMTNIANWYAYYHTRILMAKTAVGLAMNTLTPSYRVGFVTINAYSGGSLSTNQFLPIGDFTTAQRTNFYTSFYALTANNGTPLREALSRVGQYYAGLTSSSALDYGMINSTTRPDPVQYSCQQNFTILTTDGYWNGNAGSDLQGNAIDYNSTQGNQDNDSTNSFEQRAYSIYGPGGYYDGNLANSTFNGGTYTSKGTLADVAMYYYKSDLRPAGSTNYNTGLDVSADNVPTAQYVDQNPSQHMVTYTIGLGVDGYLTYDTSKANPTYNSLDYLNIVAGASGQCVWTPGNICDWPQVPTGTAYNDDPAKDDDLWHAAVNGRGAYLTAKNPQALLTGLKNDLAKIQAQVGAAAASATSTPNITLTNNAIYSTTFETVYWDGELVAQNIDPSTGVVNPKINWSESTQLEGKIAAASDTRTIYTQSAGAMVPFTYASLDATAQGYFTNRCLVLSQCSGLALVDQAIVNNGANLVNYLRGQSLYDDGSHYRQRVNAIAPNVLGDLVDSRPAVVNTPLRHYADATKAPGNQSYATFAANNASRTSVIYVGANDGMLHAFDAATGNELWAYVPRTVLPRLYALSDLAYATQHQFYVDGSPEVTDVLSPSDGLWHTLLIGGLAGGGRGFYALDVTVPTSPILLWEICSDSTLCTISDANLGLSFGNPVVTKRAYDGRWIVLLTSGYNNVSPGDGMGHLYELDPFSGAILSQVSTGVGSTTTPSGFSRITAWATNPDTDNTSALVWGGDLQGNLWRFDLTTATPTVSLMATLKDAAGKPQPITTRPDLGFISGYKIIFVGTGRMLGVTDLQDPATLSPAGNWSYVSTQYALMDSTANLGNPRTNATMVTQTLAGFGSGSTQTQRTATTKAVSFPANIGWMVDFPSTGERVVVDPQVVLGVLLVTTNIPNANACSAGGDSWLYQFNYMTGSAVTGVANSIAGTETVGALTVGNVVVQLPNTSVKIISTLSNGTKQTNGLNTSPTNTIVRRVGWRSVAQ